MSRKLAAISISLLTWTLGIGTVLSFNLWSDFNLTPGRNFLDSMDFIANQILLPLGGMLIAIFVGWFMDKNLINEEIGHVNPILFGIWRFFVKFIAPISVAIIFYNAIFG